MATYTSHVIMTLIEMIQELQEEEDDLDNTVYDDYCEVEYVFEYDYE